MESKYLIVLGAGPQQALVYKCANKIGIKTLAIDYNPDAVSFSNASDYIVAQIKNPKECINALKKKQLTYGGIIGYGIELSPVVSSIAKEFNLVSVPEEVALQTTNKCVRSRILKEKKIPIPKFEIITSFDKPEIKLPFVVKPSDNSGSRGVRLVKSINEWKSAYEEALSFSSDGRVIVEEYLNGQEISIEGFIINGKLIIYGFTDRNFIRDEKYYPYFVEDGSSCPTKLSSSMVSEVNQAFSNAVDALNINNGPSKGDLIVTKEGVKVLEITSRISPGFSLFMPYSAGVDPLTATIKWTLGEKVRASDFKPRFQKGMAHRYYFHNTGKIISITGFTDVINMDGVIKVIKLQNFEIGDTLDPVSYINRLFYIITIGQTREQAIMYAERALKSVTIKVE